MNAVEKSKIEIGSEWVSRHGEIVRVSEITDTETVCYVAVEGEGFGAMGPEHFRKRFVPVRVEPVCRHPNGTFTYNGGVACVDCKADVTPAPAPQDEAAAIEQRRQADVAALRATIERLGAENEKLRQEQAGTLRDRFAMAALVGGYALDGFAEKPEDRATDAYEIADAMIAARASGAGKDGAA